MRKILNDLFAGNLAPMNGAIRMDSEYVRLLKIVCLYEDKLETTLTGDDLAAFKKMREASQKATAIEIREAFINGFRLGIRLGVESFDDGDGIYDSLLSREES